MSSFFGYVFHDTNGQNHGEKEDSVVLLERNLYGHPLARLLMAKRIRRSFIRTCVGQSTELGMSVRSSKTRVILIGLRGCHQHGWKECRIWLPCGTHGLKIWTLTNPHHFLTMKTRDVLSVNANQMKRLFEQK